MMFDDFFAGICGIVGLAGGIGAAAVDAIANGLSYFTIAAPVFGAVVLFSIGKGIDR